MFRKILIPTDGSDISMKAAMEGMEFAVANGSEVYGLYVAPEYHYPVYIEIIPPTYPLEEEYQELMRKIGNGYFESIEEAAKKAGIAFHGEIVFSNSAASAIVQVAEEEGCDLIFMGSHGRSGLGQLILGSVTSKVLSLCKIPVLVSRPRTAED